MELSQKLIINKDQMNLEDRLKKIKLVLLDVDGTMTDGGIILDQDGNQYKKFNAQDGEGIRRAVEHGIQVGIISAASLCRKMIETRAQILGIQRVHADRGNKLEVAKRWMSELELQPDQVAFLGDDIIDREVMIWAGLGVAPANCHKSVRSIADMITERGGGHGAVREFMDALLECQSPETMYHTI
jgi:3-deoxy-D-manno-octulosonate 8-phosphate phosphatase (KDO 8-P phosphatase)